MPCLGIVEDQRGLVNAYRRVLRRRAPEVDVWVAPDLAEARALFESRKTNALVVDFGLPRSTVAEVKQWLEHVRAGDAALGIFLVSAIKDDSLVNFTTALHADRVLKTGKNGGFIVEAVGDFAVRVAEHARAATAALGDAVADVSNEARLTPRQRDVVRAAIEHPHEKCEGLVVGCRPATVRKHLENINAVFPASPKSLDALRVHVFARSHGGPPLKAIHPTAPIARLFDPLHLVVVSRRGDGSRRRIRMGRREGTRQLEEARDLVRRGHDGVPRRSGGAVRRPSAFGPTCPDRRITTGARAPGRLHGAVAERYPSNHQRASRHEERTETL